MSTPLWLKEIVFGLIILTFLLQLNQHFAIDFLLLNIFTYISFLIIGLKIKKSKIWILILSILNYNMMKSITLKWAKSIYIISIGGSFGMVSVFSVQVAIRFILLYSKNNIKHGI